MELGRSILSIAISLVETPVRDFAGRGRDNAAKDKRVVRIVFNCTRNNEDIATIGRGIVGESVVYP